MSKDYLCKCVNCGTIMFDENPDPIMGQEKINLDLYPQIENMEQIKDYDNSVFWGCPKCKTDDYFMDV